MYLLASAARGLSGCALMKVCSASVSYTHLDVYKRQGQYSIGEALKLLMEKSGWAPKAHELRMREEWEQIAGKTIAKYTRNPVSYTHLDVYKRQVFRRCAGLQNR